MTFSVMTVIRIARKNVETTAKNQFAVTSMVRDGSTSAIDSFATSVMIPSIGAIRMLTPNAAPTPAKPAARPASGCRPMLWKAAAASGISTR